MRVKIGDVWFSAGPGVPVMIELSDMASYRQEQVTVHGFSGHAYFHQDDHMSVDQRAAWVRETGNKNVIPEALTQFLAEEVVPSAAIFAETEEHVADMRRRAADRIRPLAYAYITGKETSPEVSSLAGKYLSFDRAALLAAVEQNPGQLVTDIRRMAGSALAQDETEGQG